MQSLFAITFPFHGRTLHASTARRLHRPAAWPTILCIFGTLLVVPPPLTAAAYSEDAVKAAFLYRFAAFVEWPKASSSDGPFTIGILGADAVASQLSHLLTGKTIQGRPAQAISIHRSHELNGIQMLYLGPGTASREPGLIAAAATQSILVVTDEQDGLKIGGIINFLPTTDSVRFEISLSAAERSRLKIDSGLLSVAARVEGRPGAELTCPASGPMNPSGNLCGAWLASMLAATRSRRSHAESLLPRYRSCT